MRLLLWGSGDVLQRVHSGGDLVLKVIGRGGGGGGRGRQEAAGLDFCRIFYSKLVGNLLLNVIP